MIHSYNRGERAFIQQMLDVDITGHITYANKVKMRAYLGKDYRDIVTAYLQSKHNEIYFSREKLVVDGIYGRNTRLALEAIIGDERITALDTVPGTLKGVGIDMLAKALPLWNDSAHDKVITHFSSAFSVMEGNLDKVHLHNEDYLSIYLGQVSHETGPDFETVENLRGYRCKTLIKYFKNYRKNASTRALARRHGWCDGHGSNPIGIANMAYADRFGNGGYSSGDGALYRGGGVPQLTFKANYQGYHDWLLHNLPDVYAKSQGEYIMRDGVGVVSDAPHSVLSGMYFWEMKGVHRAIKYGVTEKGSNYATRKINRYTNSYHERWVNTRRAYKLLTA